MEIEKESHYVYRLTHKLTGVYYYGVRSCNGDPYDDPYMGSSTRIRKEYKGRKKEFRKDIVSVQPTRSIAFVVEGFLVNEWQLSQDKCLNAKLGGENQHGKCSRERQLAGIAKAKAAGKYKGGKRKFVSTDKEKIKKLIEEGVSISQISRDMECSRPTIYKVINK
jgi:hypothetical protein